MESIQRSDVHFRRIRSDRAQRGTILFLHGLGESGRCFEKLMQRPELADWDRLAPDLPGYGRSGRDKAPHSIDRLVKWVSGWIEEVLPAQRPVALGHSMGGVIGQLLCERRPHAFRALVNVEGNLSLGDCDFSKRAAEFDLRTFREQGFQELLDGTARSKSPALRGYVASMRLADPDTFHLNARELVAISKTEELAYRLAKLQTPVLFMGGMEGGVCSRSQELLEQLRIKWSGIEAAGHWPFIDQENAFVEVLTGFLEQLDH